jgi:formylglycine-generating enzyme required for sulfatase activity
MKQYLIAFLLLLSTASLKANDLQIANITTNANGNVTTVSFDISWKNSWRGGIANNYDAAWVFIKYKDDNGAWHHLNLTGANNSAGAPLTIEAPGDKKGVFIYRGSDGIGDLSPVSITLGVQQQPGSYDIKVFGIEMVYVPQGSFYIGGFSSLGLFQGTTASDPQPFFINSATPPLKGNTLASELNDTRGNGVINPSFPTGYNAFYCMKYEISQAAYRDFLNSCLTFNAITGSRTSLLGNFLVPGTPVFENNNRSFLKATGMASTPIGTDGDGDGNYDEADDGEWVACNYLFWSDVAAYLDWAALRPMTEFEWAKIHRGIDLPSSLSWSTGGSVVVAASSITNSKLSTETATILPAGASGINCAELGIGGPLRNGFAATATSNRLSAGSTYWGILEISGNLSEYVVTISNNAGRSFTGMLGDGELDASGRPNQSRWPGINNNDPTQENGASGVIQQTNIAGIYSLGGNYTQGLFTSDMFQIFVTGATVPTTRSVASVFGGRGVRQKL